MSQRYYLLHVLMDGWMDGTPVNADESVTPVAQQIKQN